MIKLNTTNGIWRIFGMNLIPSDSIFMKLQKAIKEGNLEESYLMKITGHRYPIIVNKKEMSITFCGY